MIDELTIGRGAVAAIDVLAALRVDGADEVLVAVGRDGSSLAIPLPVLTRSLDARFEYDAACNRVILHVPGWTDDQLAFVVSSVYTMTFAAFVGVDCRHPWHHEPIASTAPDLTALIERVQDGDQDAFADLYDAIAPLVFGSVKRVLRDPAMSEEVTQEVFVELWTTAARFDPERASVSTWAVTIARRRAVDRVRREQSQRNRIEQLGQRRPDVEELTDDSVVASLEAERVSRALSELPPDQREIIEMAFIEGLSHSTIAEQLGLPLGTVKGRVRGGLQRLSGKLGGDS